jgi:hypothetical protein
MNEIVKQLLALVDGAPVSPAIVSERCGVSRGCFSAWRSGRAKSPRIDTMSKVAAYFHFSIQIEDGYSRLMPLRTQYVDRSRAMLSRPRMRMLLRSLQ